MSTLHDEIKVLADRARNCLESGVSEESTKNSLILPFLKALGYDPFNINEVDPEFTADVGIKKGEKVDYAVKIGGKPAIIIEAKQVATQLADTHMSQLYRYFGCSDVRVALLTNGREYRFFSDLEVPNKMDSVPFFVFDISSFSDSSLKILSGFRKDDFSIENILSNASRNLRKKAIRDYLKAQMADPAEDFIRIVAKVAHDGPFKKNVIDDMAPLVKEAFSEIVKGQIVEMLDIRKITSDTSGAQDAKIPDVDSPVTATPEDTGVITTPEEAEAFNIVRAICARSVDIDKITLRDTLSYCGVLFEDNRNKPLCRFYFGSKSVKRVHVVNGERGEKNGASLFDQFDIEKPSDIYRLQDRILAALALYTGDVKSATPIRAVV